MPNSKSNKPDFYDEHPQQKNLTDSSATAADASSRKEPSRATSKNSNQRLVMFCLKYI